MAYVRLVSSSTNSVTVCLDGMDTGYEQSNRTCTWYLDGKRIGSISLPAKVSQSSSYTFRNLSAGTEYEVVASVSAPTWESTYEFSDSFYTDEITVEEWDWYSSNGDASANQTRTALSALNNNGSLSDFNYLVWNDMVNKVTEVLNAAGSSWSTRYATYNQTLMSSSDKEITAARFNSLRFNVGSHYSTGINEVSRGDTVYGWYFTSLMQTVNNWIRSL